MNKLYFILRKEFRLIFRDKTILAMMFAVPIMQLIILPFAADFEVKHINLSYVDHDRSPYSEQLRNKIELSGYFNLVETTTSFDEAMQSIEYGRSDLLIEIPPHFERTLVREGAEEINVSIDAINGTKSQIGGVYLMAVLQEFNQNINIRYKSGEKLSASAPISVESVNWYNPRGEYKYFMVPGILVLLLTLIGGFMSALNIVREKEIGTIEQINVSPIRKWEFILGKLIPFWVVGLIVFTVGLVVMYIIYGIFPQGSLLTLYVFAAMYLVALLGFGLLVSTFADSQLQAMFIAFFFIMIFILMSGFFTSIDSMPRWAWWISQCTPVTHFIKVVRLIVLKGAAFAHVWREFVYLIGFAIVLNGAAIWNYRKTS